MLIPLSLFLFPCFFLQRKRKKQHRHFPMRRSPIFIPSNCFQWFFLESVFSLF